MAPPAASSAASGGGSAALGFLVILGLLVIVGVAVKMYDRKRKRDAEAVHLQAQVSDALMRDPRLAGLVLTPSATVPSWGSGPATIEISGEVPDSGMRDTVLRVAREEAARLRADVQVIDRLSVRQAIAA